MLILARFTNFCDFMIFGKPLLEISKIQMVNVEIHFFLLVRSKISVSQCQSLCPPKLNLGYKLKDFLQFKTTLEQS